MQKAVHLKLLTMVILIMTAVLLTACGGDDNAKGNVLKYHFADKEEAVKCYLSNEDYFKGFSKCDIQYRLQKKNGTLKEVKEFGAAQMREFTDNEKKVLEKIISEMESDLEKGGYSLPEIDEITFIKSTQAEECGSGAYTHGTQIYVCRQLLDVIGSDNDATRQFGKSVLWHELFHCLTRSNPDFRKGMYKIIHFNVQDKDYDIPPSVFEKYISNPDVEHHNSYATFKINGKDVDCYTALIAMKPFEKKGDSFFECMNTALVPVDGSDKYYLQDDAENFWDIFGKNTNYVIDPEECMADNFRFALTYGKDKGEGGKKYKSPEIIEKILDYISK